MSAAEASLRGGRAPRVLFIQATEPAGYPPLIHASMLMAEAGWDVTFLSAPIEGNTAGAASPSAHRGASDPSTALACDGQGGLCPLYRRRRPAGAATAARCRLCLRSAGGGTGLLAARLARARLVYHEHDSPAPGALRPSLARARAAAARRAELVIFPNEARARIAQAELGFSADRLRIVWNMPRRAELPPLDTQPEAPLVLYYHGSITPDRLPLAVVEAVQRLCGRACLRIAGYEAPGAAGYVQRLLELGGGSQL